MKKIWIMLCLSVAFCATGGIYALGADAGPEKDLLFFLKRMGTVEYLPELDDSHTTLQNTYQRKSTRIVESEHTGYVGYSIYKITGTTNTLLNVKGPGCVNRIITAALGTNVAGTKIQVFIDESKKPVFDMPVDKFFSGTFPAPLASAKGCPSVFFPIPFAKHCRVQLVNQKDKKNYWGDHWEVTHLAFPPETKVKSLVWPLSGAEKAEAKKVCSAWTRAVSSPPAVPGKWSVVKEFENIEPFDAKEFTVKGCGIIRQMRIAIEPAKPSMLNAIRMRIFWDGAKEPSVDLPLGYFFGHGFYGNHKEILFNSMFVGVTEKDAYSLIPMPFAKGAVFRFENRSKLSETLKKIKISLDVDKCKSLPDNYGRFHATWHEKRVNQRAAPYHKGVKSHIILKRKAKGKYVGTMLHIAWPLNKRPFWWGQGNFMIWTDQSATNWPPRYYGTGVEYYFNSSRRNFERRAISGYIRQVPGDIGVYGFHLNDAFQFKENIYAAVGTYVNRFLLTSGWQKGHLQKQPVWASVAYWYALPAQDAGSDSSPVAPRWELDFKTRKELLLY